MKNNMTANDQNSVTKIIVLIPIFLLCIAFVLLIPAVLSWICNTGIAGYIMFFTLFLFISVLISLLKANSSLSWRSVEGTITESILDGSRPENTSPRIKYSYFVDASEYSNTNVKFGKSVRIKSEAQKAIDKFKAGSKVQVFYNPLKPQNSVLEPGVDKSSLLLPVVLLLSMCTAAWFAFKNWSGFKYERLGPEFIDFFKGILS